LGDQIKENNIDGAYSMNLRDMKTSKILVANMKLKYHL